MLNDLITHIKSYLATPSVFFVIEIDFRQRFSKRKLIFFFKKKSISVY